MNQKDALSPGEHYVKIREVKLWYYVQGNGPVLLLQPAGAGWGGDVTLYIKTLKPIEKIRTVIYLEPRGLGRSQRLNDPLAYRINEYVNDIEAIRKLLGISQIAIVAHSHGGFVALKYALDYPEMVERLLLIDTTPYIFLGNYSSWLRGRKGYKEAFHALKKLQKNSSISPDEKERATLKILLPVIHFYDYDKVSLLVSDVLTRMVVSAQPHQYFNNHEAAKYDLRGSIHRIPAPTLIITGDDDMPHIRMGSNLLKERIPNANLTVIKKCGHWPMIEAPDEFFKATTPFLSK